MIGMSELITFLFGNIVLEMLKPQTIGKEMRKKIESWLLWNKEIREEILSSRWNAQFGWFSWHANDTNNEIEFNNVYPQTLPESLKKITYPNSQTQNDYLYCGSYIDRLAWRSLKNLIAKPEVLGSILNQDKYFCDEHEYLFCVWV